MNLLDKDINIGLHNTTHMYILINVSRNIQDLNNRVKLYRVKEIIGMRDPNYVVTSTLRLPFVTETFYCVTMISLFRLNELLECESHHKDLFNTWAATQSAHDITEIADIDFLFKLNQC